jgi:transcriptional regulator with XRE-family HTH domain
LKKVRFIEKKIGQKIRQLRKDWGFSQIELAEKIGVSFQQIQKYEKGATRISVMRLQEISDALGISITSFFEEYERAPKVSDHTIRYSPGGTHPEGLQPLSKEDVTLLKLFRKVKNKKVKEGIIKQVRGLIELEKQK